jgi:hypothetical protein
MRFISCNYTWLVQFKNMKVIMRIISCRVVKTLHMISLIKEYASKLNTLIIFDHYPRITSLTHSQCRAGGTAPCWNRITLNSLINCDNLIKSYNLISFNLLRTSNNLVSLNNLTNFNNPVQLCKSKSAIISTIFIPLLPPITIITLTLIFILTFRINTITLIALQILIILVFK